MRNRTLRSMFMSSMSDRTTIFDFSNPRTMTQDVEGLIPLTVPGQRAGRVYALTQNYQTGGQYGPSLQYHNYLGNNLIDICPTYREENGRGYLDFTGSEYLTYWWGDGTMGSGCMNAMMAMRVTDATSNPLGCIVAGKPIEYIFSGDYSLDRWYNTPEALSLTTRLWSNLTQTRSISVGVDKVYTADGSGKWSSNVKLMEGILLGAHPSSADNFVGRAYGLYLNGDSTADVWPDADRELKIKAFAAKYGITL